MERMYYMSHCVILSSQLSRLDIEGVLSQSPHRRWELYSLTIANYQWGWKKRHWFEHTTHLWPGNISTHALLCQQRQHSIVLCKDIYQGSSFWQPSEYSAPLSHEEVSLLTDTAIKYNEINRDMRAVVLFQYSYKRSKAFILNTVLWLCIDEYCWGIHYPGVSIHFVLPT